MSALTATHRAQALAAVRPRHLGRVADLRGLHLTVTGLRAAVGELLEVLGPDGVVPIEVVASSRDSLTCLPLAGTSGLRAGDHVHHTGGALRIGVGEELRGRVVDGLGRPLDGGPPLDHLLRVSVEHPAPRALSRPRSARAGRAPRPRRR